MTRKGIVTVAALASLAFSGCASSPDRYPSLDIRPVERVTGTFETVAPPPTATSDTIPSAQLPERLAELRNDALSAHDAFLAAEPRARSLANAANGAAIDSNAWGDAQVALADLESLRSQAAIALGDLDILYTDATLQAVDRSQIDTVRDAVIEVLREEDRALAELRGKVR